MPLDPTLPTVDWATPEEMAALHERFRAECGNTTWEHAFPVWLMDHMEACSNQLPLGQELDIDILLAWILDPNRRSVLH